MKTNFTILIFGWLVTCLLFNSARAQTGVISGQITDGAKPVEAATALLLRLPDSTVVLGSLTDDKGAFLIEKVKPGRYCVKAQFVGYADGVSAAFELKEGESKQINLTIKETTTQLETVSIVARKPFIEQSAEKTTLNVEKSLSSSGLTALDVIKRAPGAQVGSSGDIKLKGKSGVLVLINGRALYFEPAQLAAYLKTLPADQIQSIDIMTNPPAQYDAEGNAGVINIKLKKGAYNGFNGSANVSLMHGYYPKAAAGVNLSYRKDKLTLNFAYQYNFRKNLMRFSVNRIYAPGSANASFQTQNEQGSPEHQNGMLLGANYQLNDRTSFSLETNANYTLGAGYGGSTSQLMAPDGSLNQRLNSNDTTSNRLFNLMLAAGMKHAFDTSGTELSVQADFSNLLKSDQQDITTRFVDSTGAAIESPALYTIKIPAVVRQWSAKADFSMTKLKIFNIEAGLKYTGVRTDNDNQSFITQNNEITQLNNHFLYNEDIAAGYLQLNRSYKKWRAQAGLRAEYTHTLGKQLSSDTTFTRSYANLFPSASLTFQATEKTSFTAQYNRRIDRPNYNNVNPFVYYTDRYNGYAGNPYLLPQITDNVELTGLFFQGALMTTFSYSRTNRPIADLYQLDPVKLTTVFTSSNLDYLENFGLSAAVNLPITKWWMCSAFGYGYYSRNHGDMGFGQTALNQWAFLANTTQSFTLPKGFSLELTGDYMSKFAFFLRVYRPVWQVGLAAQKKLWGDRASVRLAITDAFWTYYWRGTGKIGETTINDDFRWDNRFVSLTFTYHFGNRFKIEGAAKALQIKTGGAGRQR